MYVVVSWRLGACLQFDDYMSDNLFKFLCVYVGPTFLSGGRPYRPQTKSVPTSKVSG